MPWARVKECSTLTRRSGSEDEARVVRSIAGQLTAFGVDHTIHHPVYLIHVVTKQGG